MKGLSATDKDNFFVELEFSFRPSASWEEAQSSEGFEGRKEGLIAFLPARITCFVCLFFSLACSLIRSCQVSSHIVYAYCMSITKKIFRVVKWHAVQDLFVLNVSMYLRCVRDLVPQKKNVPKVVFIHGLYFFQSHNEQHYYFHFRRTKRRYLLLKRFFFKEWIYGKSSSAYTDELYY